MKVWITIGWFNTNTGKGARDRGYFKGRCLPAGCGLNMPSLGVFAMVFDEEGRILCVRMNYATRNWTTPGGRVEAGESPVAALKRETLEESGYEIEVGELIGAYWKTYADDVVLCFEGRVLSRSPWMANEEISEVRWFHRRELPGNMSLVVRTRIGDAFDGARGVFREFHEPDSDDS